MSVLGAFNASTLGAFQSSTLGARGGAEPVVAAFRYLIAVNGVPYYYDPSGDSWISMGATGAPTIRSMKWLQGELWTGTDSSLTSAIARHNGQAWTPLDFNFAGADACTDFIDVSGNLFCWALLGGFGIGAPGRYNIATDAFDIDSGGFNDLGTSHLALGGFGRAGPLWAFHGPFDASSVNSWEPFTDWPVEVPTNVNVPIVKEPDYPSDPARQTAFDGSRIIISGWGMADPGLAPQTAFKSTPIIWTGSEASLQPVDGAQISGQYRWQTSQTHSAIDDDGAGNVLAAGAEWDGAARSEGLLKIDGAIVSKPLSCTTGEVLGVAKEAGGRVLIGGSFSDFDENPTSGPPIPMDRLAFYDDASGLPELWSGAAPPAGIVQQTLTIPIGVDPTVGPVPSQESELGQPYVFTVPGSAVTRWRMIGPTTPELPPIDPNTGQITWDPLPVPAFGLPYHIMQAYGGNDSWWATTQWFLWVAEAITMPVLGSDSHAGVAAYQSANFDLVAGAGEIQYSVPATDLPDPGAVDIQILNTARTRFRVQVFPIPAPGTYFITVRATNSLGFDESTLTVEFTP